MTMLENVAKEQKPLIGKSMEDLEAFSQSLGQELFRGRQLFDWIYRKNVYNFSEMSDLPISLREKLSGMPLHPLRMVNDHVSNSKQTQKFLFELESGEFIESVLMKDGKRVTVCLSTQVGCAVDCDFCATGKMGFIQNLTAGEIVDQFLQLQNIIKDKIRQQKEQIKEKEELLFIDMDPLGVFSDTLIGLQKNYFQILLNFKRK